MRQIEKEAIILTFKKAIALLLTTVMTLTAAGIVPVAAEDIQWDRAAYYQESIADYSQFDYSDPQHISDEDFFGVWENDSWTKEPYFRYEDFPEMSAVEEAAKNGDYPTCKEELLSYYRAKHETYTIDTSVSKNYSDKTLASYEMGMDNVIAGGASISGRLILGKEKEWTSADVLEDVSAVVSTLDAKNLKYDIMASRKDGYTAVIDSCETEFAPYIEVEVNGTIKKYTAVTDTYIDYGDRTSSHGDSEALLVEESVSSIGNDVPYDEFTKRMLIQFDFTGLTATDQITAAKMYIHGNFDESECPAGVRLPSDTKSLYFFRWTAVPLLENDITGEKYMSLPSSYITLNGESGSKLGKTSESSGSLSRLGSCANLVDPLSRGYLATGNEDFAYHAIRFILNEYINRGSYQNVADLHIAQPGLQMPFYTSTQLSLRVVPYIHRLIKSEHMTPEAYTAIMKFNWINAEFLVNFWEQAEEYANWGSYSVSGLETAAMYYPEFRSTIAPLGEIKNQAYPGSRVGGWNEVANFRRAYKMKQDVNPDGTSVENSLEYSFEALENYIHPISLGEQLGIDVDYCFRDEEANELLSKALDYIVGNMNPRFGDWQFGDTASYNWDYSERLRPFLKLIDNPMVEYVVERRGSGTIPDFKSIAYDSVGRVNLRTTWERDDSIAAHIENSGVGSHAHNDNLSITMAAYGKYLLVDPRMNAYDVNNDPQERWVSSTRGHNTVEINETIAKGGRSYAAQQPDYFGDKMVTPTANLYKLGDLYPQNREFNDVYDFVRGETFGYQGHSTLGEDFTVKRDTLFVKSGYFIVSDYLLPQKDSEKENLYRQLWHFAPGAEPTVDNENNIVKTNFNGTANVYIATVKDNSDVHGYLKDGLYATERGKFDIVPYGIFEQNTKGLATFNTLLYPVPASTKVDIKTTDIELQLPDGSADSFVAEITDRESQSVKNIHYYNLYDESVKDDVTFGSHETDGAVALKETDDGKHTNVVLRRGSYIKNILDDTYSVYSEEELEDIGIYWQNDEIDISYDIKDENNSLDLSKLTVRANNIVSKVTLNGVKVDFSQDGNYIYFSEEPIIDGGTPDGDDSSSGDTGSGSTDSGNTGSDSGDGDSDTPIHGGGGSGDSGNTGSIGSRPGGSGSSGSSSAGTGNNKPEKKDPKPSDAYAEALQNHWAKKEISDLVDKGIVKGYEDGSLGLDKNITKAEFITLLIRALGVENEKYDDVFSDVSADDWYAEYISTAYKNGWIAGDGSGNVLPGKNATREEMTKIVVGAYEQLFGKIDDSKRTDFTDSDDISSWANEYVTKAVNAGLINGMDTGEFKPLDNAKREQAMVIIYRILNKE